MSCFTRPWLGFDDIYALRRQTGTYQASKNKSILIDFLPSPVGTAVLFRSELPLLLLSCNVRLCCAQSLGKVPPQSDTCCRWFRMHSREAQIHQYRVVFLRATARIIHSILVGENGLLGLLGTLGIEGTAQCDPTENQQEKPDPGFLETSVPDFPPSRSPVLPRQCPSAPCGARNIGTS